MPRVSATSRSRTRSSSCPGRGGGQQRPGVVRAEALDGELRYAGEQVVLPRLADRQSQQDRLAHQPPRDHAEHLAGRLVQPLRVVDQHDERLFGCHLRKNAEHGQTDDEAIRRRTGGEAECHPQGLLLVRRHRLHLAEQRSAELVQRREGQLQLRLDTREPEDAAVGGPVRDVPQERGLADACLAAEDEHHALPAADPVEGVVQRLALAGAPAEVRRRSGHCATVGLVSGLRNLSLPPESLLVTNHDVVTDSPCEGAIGGRSSPRSAAGSRSRAGA